MNKEIATTVDEELYHAVARVASLEGRPIEELLRSMVSEYVERIYPQSNDKNGLAHFLSRKPLNLSREQILETMEADPYDQ